MAEVYFAGDGHIGHRNILKFREGFSSIEDHDSTILNNFNKKVSKRDKTFFTGDWCFTEESIDFMKRFNGSKHLVMGNHEILTPKLWDVFDFVSGPIKYKEFWVTHIPIHPLEMRGKFNIHGHVHGSTIQDRYFINTSLEAINYTPISLQEIRSILS